jgi:predicted NAD/FAD-binding protein
MRIAIIGGGAAGITTAYLLQKNHHVTLFEKEKILGGHVRTLNKNVSTHALERELVLDAGVLEFQKDRFTYFHKLMAELGVKLEPCSMSSELFISPEKCFKSGGGIIYGDQSLREQVRDFLKICPLLKNYFSFLLQAHIVSMEELQNQPVSRFLKSDPVSIWFKMLLMYAYSMPLDKIENFPAEIAIPLLAQSHFLTQWDRIPEGVYTYFEKILERFDGTIYYDTPIQSVYRNPYGVSLTLNSGDRLWFDKVVFAVSPHQVLPLLANPLEEEIRRFGAWQKNLMETVVHTDVSFYKNLGVSYFGEFDVFKTEGKPQGGYNAYLNRLYKIDPKKYGHYSLAFQLKHLIDPQKIIHHQHHETPLYTVDALRYRDEIIACNGEYHTFHAGAYLGEGLHEGAIKSAYIVAQLLEEKNLEAVRVKEQPLLNPISTNLGPELIF